MHRFLAGIRTRGFERIEAAAMDSVPRYNLERLSVFILDDNRNMRLLLRSILTALGVNSIEDASNAGEGFSQLKHFLADIVITDWHMEPVDGLEFVRMLRTARDSPNPYVPIIMLTGHTEMWRVTRARDVGVNEFLAKPISAKGIYARIASCIENPRPFIRTKAYFGPDRRRQDLGPPIGMKERRYELLHRR